MRNKKKSKREKTPEREALEKHVDAMMDPKHPDGPEPAAAETPEVPAIKAVSPPVDAEAPKTAPALSPKLRKQIAVDHGDEPLSIDNLDEQIKNITEAKPAKKPKKAAKPEKSEETEEPEEAPEPEEQANVTDEGLDLDDAETDKAVDDIVAYEGDVVLAVADSTAAERNREVLASRPKGHPILATFFWTLIALVAILIIALGALLAMGDSIADKLGL